MRQTIRAAEAEGFRRIAVVCGAWHAPALAADRAGRKDDAALLKGLPKAKVAATWVPWTHGRLASRAATARGSSRPAGIIISGHPSLVIERWVTRVGPPAPRGGPRRLLGPVIETVRLAEALAALRAALARPARAERGVQAVFCFGDPCRCG